MFAWCWSSVYPVFAGVGDFGEYKNEYICAVTPKRTESHHKKKKEKKAKKKLKKKRKAPEGMREDSHGPKRTLGALRDLFFHVQLALKVPTSARSASATQTTN